MTVNQPLDSKEVQEFQFKLICRLNVFSDGEFDYSGYLNLVATASKYNLAFVGCPSGVQAIIISAVVNSEAHGNKSLAEYPHRKLNLGNQPSHLSISCDQSCIVIAVKKDGCPHALIYSVSSFLSKNITLLNEVRLSASLNTHILDLTWNPGIPNIFATCLSDGTVGVYEFKTTGTDIKTLPSEAQAACFSWSPRGKQLVVGTRYGELIQYKPDLKPVKTLPAPTLSENPVSVVNVTWISNYQFAAVYHDKVNETERPGLVIVNAPKSGAVSFVNFDDICYSSGELRRPQFYLHHQQTWNVILVASANSMEVGVIGLTEDQLSWQQWMQEDACRAELPMSSDKQETFPIGLALDTSTTHELPWGDNQMIPPMPVLHLLSHKGVLCLFYVINVIPGAVTVCSPPEKVADESVVALFSSKAPDVSPATEISPTGSRVNLAPKFENASVPKPMAPVQSIPLQKEASSPTLQTNVSEPGIGILNSGFSSPFFSVKASVASATEKPQPTMSFINSLQSGAGGNISGFSTGKLTGANLTQAPSPISSQSNQAPSLTSSFISQMPSVMSSQSNLTPSVMSSQSNLTSSVMSSQSNLTPSVMSSQSNMTPSVMSSQSNMTPSVMSSQSNMTPSVMSSQSNMTPSVMSSQSNMTPSVMSSQNSLTPSGMSSQSNLTPSLMNPQSSLTPSVVGSQSTLAPSVMSSQNKVAPSMTSSQSNIMFPASSISVASGDGRNYSTPVKVDNIVQPNIDSLSSTESNEITANVIRAAIAEEIQLFERELADLRKRVNSVNTHVGIQEERTLLQKKVENMEEFCHELEETTRAQTTEVQSLRGLMMETFVWVEDARSRRRKITKPPELEELPLLQDLDPVILHYWTSIQQSMFYVENQLKQLNDTLDLDWQQFQNACKKNSGNTLQVPTLEAIYKVLTLENSILLKKRADVEKIIKQVDQYRKRQGKRTSLLAALNSSKRQPFDKGENDISRLAEKLLQSKLSDTDAVGSENIKKMVSMNRRATLTARQKKLSAKKQNVLQDLLMQHVASHITPIKTVRDRFTPSSSLLNLAPFTTSSLKLGGILSGRPVAQNQTATISQSSLLTASNIQQRLSSTFLSDNKSVPQTFTMATNNRPQQTNPLASLSNMVVGVINCSTESISTYNPSGFTKTGSAPLFMFKVPNDTQNALMARPGTIAVRDDVHNVVSSASSSLPLTPPVTGVTSYDSSLNKGISPSFNFGQSIQPAVLGRDMGKKETSGSVGAQLQSSNVSIGTVAKSVTDVQQLNNSNSLISKSSASVHSLFVNLNSQSFSSNTTLASKSEVNSAMAGKNQPVCDTTTVTQPADLVSTASSRSLTTGFAFSGGSPSAPGFSFQKSTPATVQSSPTLFGTSFSKGNTSQVSSSSSNLSEPATVTVTQVSPLLASSGDKKTSTSESSGSFASSVSQPLFGNVQGKVSAPVTAFSFGQVAVSSKSDKETELSSASSTGGSIFGSLQQKGVPSFSFGQSATTVSSSAVESPKMGSVAFSAASESPSASSSTTSVESEETDLTKTDPSIVKPQAQVSSEMPESTSASSVVPPESQLFSFSLSDKAPQSPVQNQATANTIAAAAAAAATTTATSTTTTTTTTTTTSTTSATTTTTAASLFFGQPICSVAPTGKGGANIFSQAAGSKQVFGNLSTTANSSIFGTGQSNTAVTKTLFGSSATNTSSPPTTATTSSLFTNVSKSTSLFGTASTTVFSNTPLFGGSSSPAVTASAPSPPSGDALSVIPTSVSEVSSTIAISTSPSTTTQPDTVSVVSGSSLATPDTSTTAPATLPTLFGTNVTKVSNSAPSVFGTLATPAAVSSSNLFATPSTVTPTTVAAAFGASTAPTTVSPTVTTVVTTGTTASSITTVSSSRTAAPTATTTTTTSSSVSPIFGGSAVPTTLSSLFGAISITTSAPSLFGAAVSTSTSAPSLFGSAVATSQSGFGATTTSAPSLFGTSLQPSAAPSLFGQPQVSQSTTPSLFGSTPATSTPSLFGGNTDKPSLFGGNSTQSSTSIFGGKPVFGQSPVATSSSAFGQTANVFGQNTTPVFGGGTSGDGFGSKPAFGQTGGSVFGQTPKFGFGGSTFGGGTSLFGGSSTAGNSFKPGGGFGSAPVFGAGSPGGSAGFGSPPTFGGAPTFGGSPTFGSANRVFGSPAAASPSFGASPTGQQQSNTFESLASQNTLTFGNLASQSPGFGSPQPSLFGGTQTSPNNPPAFSSSSSTSFGGSSFSSWR
ncbi:nuclear pore complex protein Nup214 isoform X2 [Schistocerca cancellata]|uniref:nuclear pore complex protein Nup214 isoform X2 n=1 Tax=Schistocerca cancellata TaxID=274614 RepID=UPI0021190F82|nr:nuclear pore complex protein Nup214 isoform X2 [Schistocerca cancellata]